jgi:TM2 domain-containing membrane protein YozV
VSSPEITIDMTPGGAMSGQGSAGNVIAALASFFIPGLGQLLQGRFLKAFIMFVLAACLWIVMLGWIIHLWSIIDAALYRPKTWLES